MPETIHIPLLKDHHSHPMFYSAFDAGVCLESVETKEEAIELLRSCAQESNSELTVAHGWRSNCFQWNVEDVETLPPVAIFNVSLHSLVTNSTAKQFLQSKFGNGVQQLEDRDWYEKNMRTVLNWFANLNASVESLRAFYDRMLEIGVYYIEELLLVDENEINLFEEANLLDRTKFWAAPDTYFGLSVSAKNRVHGLKLFTDGAIGSLTAALNRPYLNDLNDSKNLGMLMYSNEELDNQIAGCFETKKSLAVHAIGDRAIEQVIESLERAKPVTGSIPEIRIEHAQLITRELADRARSLGVKLCMQPNFSSDSTRYQDRIDANYCSTNNPFRMLIDEAGFVPGEDLIFGSDGMPHGVEPAIKESLSPAFAHQQLTVDEFVAGYCLPDDSAGSIELEID